MLCKGHAQVGWEAVRKARALVVGLAHSLESKEDVRSKMCKHPGCKTRAFFSLPGQRAMLCKVHALGGMEAVRKTNAPEVGLAHSLESMEDVRSKMCKHPGCKTRASFSLPGQRAMLCKVHALEGMKAVRKTNALEV